MIKKIAILGSTGSIGKSTIDVARHLGKEICQVTALAAHSNINLLEEQAKEFNPSLVAVFQEDKALQLQKRLPHIEVVTGMEGVIAVAKHDRADMVISAMSGTLGLIPTVAAIEAGKNIGLANKEALVSGGELVMRLAKENKIQLLPIDSEHSAIFQCLNGEDNKAINRIILTSSGGPFRSYTQEQIQNITVDNALKHPTWSMGPKITIDSSTLMNKGLEVIEAHWLFNMPINKIDVIVHPQSIIHSMVEFHDFAIMAQMGEPSMKVPIQYAITYPERRPGTLQSFNFTTHNILQFFEPDKQKFRCLALAYQAIQSGGSLPCYMNAANEVLVHRFLDKQFSWIEIGQKLETLMQQHGSQPVATIEQVIEIDVRARKEAKSI